MGAAPTSPCELCDSDGGSAIFRSEKWRVVRVEGADGEAFTGFCRVVWNEHIRELTDLSVADRQRFMEIVFVVEAALRASLSPHKMNVASLGNLTPHLHWHVIPRFTDDPAFPKPVWAVPLSAAAGLATLPNGQSRGSRNDDWEGTVRRALESSRAGLQGSALLF